jgi:hypothetical protein
MSSTSPDVFAGAGLESLASDDSEGTPAERLAGRVRKVRTRAGSGDLDRWLLVIGGVLLPLGFLLVLLGWLGASHTPLVFEQVPYLISGGLLGACLVFAGGFVYFAYWQTVQVRDARSQHRQLLDSLDRIEALIAAGGAAGGGSLDQPANAATPVAGLPFVSTAKGSLFHRVDCPVVLGRPGLRAVSADDPALSACRICDPLGSR